MVTELMDVVSFAACFSFFGCCDSHVLFSKAVAKQSVKIEHIIMMQYFTVLRSHVFLIALCCCFMDFHILSCWPEKTSICKDRHHNSAFVHNFITPDSTGFELL